MTMSSYTRFGLNIRVSAELAPRRRDKGPGLFTGQFFIKWPHPRMGFVLGLAVDANTADIRWDNTPMSVDEIRYASMSNSINLNKVMTVHLHGWKP
jgi:hypothetical protein